MKNDTEKYISVYREFRGLQESNEHKWRIFWESEQDRIIRQSEPIPDEFATVRYAVRPLSMASQRMAHQPCVGFVHVPSGKTIAAYSWRGNIVYCIDEFEVEDSRLAFALAGSNDVELSKVERAQEMIRVVHREREMIKKHAQEQKVKALAVLKVFLPEEMFEHIAEYNMINGKVSGFFCRAGDTFYIEIEGRNIVNLSVSSAEGETQIYSRDQLRIAIGHFFCLLSGVEC